MNRIALAVVLGVGIVVGVIFGVYPQLDLKLAALFYDPATHRFIAFGDWVDLRSGCGDVADYVSRRPGGLCDRRQTHHAAAAHADSRPCGAVSECLAGGRTVPPGQRDLEGSLGAHAAGGHGSVRRGEKITAWWDPTGPCPDNCSFIAGEPSAAFWTFAPASLRAAAMAAAGLCRRADIRRRDGRIAHGRRRAFFQRCGFCRRAHVFGDVDAARVDLPLAADAVDRRGRRTPARAGRQQASRGGGAADRAQKPKLLICR